jgi:hypothetical protein
MERGADQPSQPFGAIVSQWLLGKAAREATITHFADVNACQVDWVLNGYGKYLEDTRMIPALEKC